MDHPAPWVQPSYAAEALLAPLEEEPGWSRATTAGAVSLNRRSSALTAPFADALLVALDSGLTLLSTSAWQLWVLWGLAVGLGTGSIALVFGA